MYQKPYIVFMVIICVDTDDQLFYSQVDLLTSKSIHWHVKPSTISN